jgi:LPXTG-motif cell wall-anchored protein
MQVDLRFITDDGRSDGGNGDDGNGGGGNGGSGNNDGRSNHGGLPRTGVNSIIVMLLVGLITSLAATSAVIITIRLQSAKDKKRKLT